MVQEGPIDCTDLFDDLTLVGSCEYWTETDNCTNEETACYVELNYDRVDYSGDCDEVMAELFGHDNETGCEDEWDGPYECFDEYSDVEGLQACEYYWIYDCIGDLVKCHAEVTVDGIDWEGHCYDLLEIFGQDPPTDGDSRCLEWVEESCLDEPGTPGIDGDLGFTECTVYKYVDVCE